MKVTQTNDIEFYIDKERTNFTQQMTIMRTSFNISHELLRMAKSGATLIEAATREALASHIAFVEKEMLCSVKSTWVDGGSGTPWRRMAGIEQLEDLGIPGPYKIVGLKDRVIKLVKRSPFYGDLSFVPDYDSWEFISELGVGVERDGREVMGWNPIGLFAEKYLS